MRVIAAHRCVRNTDPASLMKVCRWLVPAWLTGLAMGVTGLLVVSWIPSLQKFVLGQCWNAFSGHLKTVLS